MKFETWFTKPDILKLFKDLGINCITDITHMHPYDDGDFTEDWLFFIESRHALYVSKRKTLKDRLCTKYFEVMFKGEDKPKVILVNIDTGNRQVKSVEVIPATDPYDNPKEV